MLNSSKNYVWKYFSCLCCKMSDIWELKLKFTDIFMGKNEVKYIRQAMKWLGNALYQGDYTDDNSSCCRYCEAKSWQWGPKKIPVKWPTASCEKSANIQSHSEPSLVHTFPVVPGRWIRLLNEVRKLRGFKTQSRHTEMSETNVPMASSQKAISKFLLTKKKRKTVNWQLPGYHSTQRPKYGNQVESKWNILHYMSCHSAVIFPILSNV